ncbi:Fidgetin-like protein, partial [Globisporangium polare]
MASRLYELLKVRDDAESADTQREILRCLQNTQVAESERAGLDALKRLHLEKL